MRGPFRIERLGKHIRSAFDCGTGALNQYFKTQIGQDIRRNITSCFVALDEAGTVAGFYTLAAASIVPTDLPEDVARRLPRYPSIPAYRIGRLAVDRRVQGQKLGAALLADAILRAARLDAAGYALLVDAKDEKSANFYQHHGFLDLNGRCLYLPLARCKSTGAQG